ncbi:hypothetical protein IFM89_021827 [Coptis chinensis]|uniref:Cysteine-rich transmembrane domain-containing protein n=1 Tax=Coptis chinensis TaxID=261450 RepID=A0A835I450_9MAGN|nr:hypothetical protein IFM89_021827 [Coptis chinensis]
MLNYNKVVTSDKEWLVRGTEEEPNDSISSHKPQARMNDPKYAYPYPAQGYYQGPPVMAPPQYAAPPPRRQPGFLKGCPAALCCCCLLAECCGHPSIIFVG